MFSVDLQTITKRGPTTRTRPFKVFRLENVVLPFRTSMSPAHDDSSEIYRAYLVHSR